MPNLVAESGIVEPPSVFLPPLKAIRTISQDAILKTLTSLRIIYLPQVRGSSRKRDKATTTTNFHSPAKNEALEAIRADVFERSFTIQWLIRFISFSSKDHHDNPIVQSAIVEEATALLAICAGPAASGIITRTFTFPLRVHNTIKFQDISIILQDAAFDPSDTLEGTSSVGMQTWGACYVLAEMIAENPGSFDISARLTSCAPLRILELGAGTGLVSIALAKMLEKLRALGDPIPPVKNVFESDVVIATDFHPAVLTNLQSNFMANFPSQIDTIQVPEVMPEHTVTPSVFVYPLNWATFHEEYKRDPISSISKLPVPLQETFNVIVGADVVYENSHATWIHTCLQHFLKRPSPSLPGALFHLIIPLRQTHIKESSSVEQVFPKAVDIYFSHNSSGTIDEEVAPQLAIFYQEDIICNAYTDQEADEVVYRYYKIGWA